MKHFDWVKAARLIIERGYTDADAGLLEDLHYTTGQILKDGKPRLDGGAYLTSEWATPVLITATAEGDRVVVKCYLDGDGPSNWTPEALALFSPAISPAA